MTDSLPMHVYVVPLAFYEWLAGIEKDVRVHDLMPEEIAGLANALSTRPAPASPPGLVEAARAMIAFDESGWEEKRHDVYALRIRAIREALAALSPDARVLPIEGEPVAFVSPGQFAALEDKTDEGGSYLPVRKTKAGLFTMPLYATPATDEWQQAIEAAAKETAAWLRTLAGNCQCEAANLYRDAEDDEVAETWRVRGESFGFIADQIERGDSPLKVSHPLQGEG